MALDVGGSAGFCASPESLTTARPAVAAGVGAVCQGGPHDAESHEHGAGARGWLAIEHLVVPARSRVVEGAGPAARSPPLPCAIRDAGRKRHGPASGTGGVGY